MSEDILKFDLDIKTKHVEISGEPYVLKELNGKQRDKFLNSVIGRTKGAGGNQVSNVEGLQSGLVAMALKKVEDGEEKAVEEKTIQSWPAAVVTSLFREAKTLSAIDVDEEEQGND